MIGHSRYMVSELIKINKAFTNERLRVKIVYKLLEFCLPAEHGTFGFNLHVCGLQHELLHADGKPQSHSSPLSTNPLPHVGESKIFCGTFLRQLVAPFLKVLKRAISLWSQSNGLSLKFPLKSIVKMDPRFVDIRFAI